ncbi:thiamine phosphate synthase [Allobacillus sp. GCM10007491]|uniref:Thiamine-phosphate synthase n=1 Tax=Allobacillus saliphilus TaxID=2912308 RepID=A0A941HTB6_9BACI|nr:thiamine phosphate synthase [Allobacillus saliphilus]MBR7554666.1 thiamine phosphate synthase [Allobacillus saliphilus]
MVDKRTEQIKELLPVYFIMGSTNCNGRDPVRVLEEAIAGGITLFQFREKGESALTGKEKVRLAERLKKICQENHIPFIVNDDLDLAIELDAHGIHVGQDDLEADIVREKFSNKILGVSAHTIEEAEQAIKDGADYLGLGPIYPTNSKDDAREVAGTGIIECFRNHGITIPIVGIGGITPANAEEVIQASADGVAVISAIASSSDVKETAKSFLRATSK